MSARTENMSFKFDNDTLGYISNVLKSLSGDLLYRFDVSDDRQVTADMQVIQAALLHEMQTLYEEMGVEPTAPNTKAEAAGSGEDMVTMLKKHQEIMALVGVGLTAMSS